LSIEPALGDLNNKESLIEACTGIDLVIHLAGTAHVGSAAKGMDAQANAVGAENLLSAAIEQGVSRFVFLSSSLAQAAESGAGDVTDYGKAKLATERLLADRSAEIEFVVIRAVNVYGVGMKGNIAKMIDLISRNRLPRLPALSSRISLVGVEDLAVAIILATKSPLATGKTYTVTDSEVYGINAIEEAIYRILSKPLSRWRTPAVLLYAASGAAGIASILLGGRGSISLRTYRNLTTDNMFDNDKICTELGFVPSTSFYQELPKIAAAYRKEK
tara:strand:+ start:262 stop:1083 length:822 start_codon:yes stop_codon:yes gene_type:complete